MRCQSKLKLSRLFQGYQIVASGGSNATAHRQLVHLRTLDLPDIGPNSLMIFTVASPGLTLNNHFADSWLLLVHGANCRFHHPCGWPAQRWNVRRAGGVWARAPNSIRWRWRIALRKL